MSAFPPPPDAAADPGHDPIRASDAVIQRLRANHPTLIDLSTGRVERLLAALGRPDLKLPPVIHVAGTNGKGSTVAYLRAIGEAAGLRVHALTSPHLVRFAERIRLAGRLITDDELNDLTDRVEAANDGQPISFFEITTVLAFLAFAETPADLCIVEVGLGGRFDATNVFDAPAVSVITPVDYDHLEMLGPGLPKIAWEKAGIIKRGRPVVVARQPDEALEMIEREADDRMAPMLLMGRDFDAWEERGRLLVQMPDRLLDLPPPSLFGGYQFANAGVAAAAALTFDHALPDEVVGRGVSSAVWPARMQRLTTGPLADLARARGSDLWLDGGHNPHAGRALAEAASRIVDRDPRSLVLVAGMFARKDAEGFFRPFAEMRPRVICTGFDSPIAAPAEDLAAAAAAVGLDAETAANVQDAVARALESDGPAPHVLVCGGLHFAGEVLAMSRETWPT
ncbi:folylpolyglutamate synthase/dihydrofolate synthase family protein [Phenylobacterium sp. SCN 70-31]|uniref:bifunctional folylpolyglutamate synthase/dihydrofolate synthase n=1 Tax=Phenylobacterium sp. SCN 70-31 TaxID=1660129 RepID=UPI00086EA7E0|nr:folylpolyglutamate synthase/dihydrofolate synthase family protein [Phenylobacterium sp. SCN 70-31]ODT85490.1 MAG: bifunctional folylpolyglutamate synthase/dihydrofolate synthase [Phenylobacterium sp. SCN 70-31]